MRRREALWHGCRVEMTRLEFRILAALVVAAGGVVTRDDLYRTVWRQASPDDGERIVAHIRRIRAKLEADPTHPAFLLTARGEGFRLADPPEVAGAEELRSA
jgi:DNA-binding response OmpR family regulator